jgi:hypothetical protein
MSKPDNLEQDFPQTPITDAYQYQSYSSFINTSALKKTQFSPQCVFCGSNETILLMNDGSFRSCNRCKKQFKAKIIN